MLGAAFNIICNANRTKTAEWSTVQGVAELNSFLKSNEPNEINNHAILL